MREFQGEAARDAMGAGADSRADDSERYIGDSLGQARVVVQDADTRTALALAYRELVEIENVACGPGDAAPQSDHDRHSGSATGAEGDRASHTSAEHGADSRDRDHVAEQAERRHKTGRATPNADLSLSAKDLPPARDVLPNIRLAEVDDRKLSEYSLNPDHPGNNGKANGWRALGYDVDTPEGRRDAARELSGLICDELLARGKVAETRDTEYGPSHRVLSGLTGPNGRHATLVTCWQIEDRAGVSVPKLTTVWAQPHRDKESG